MRETLRDLVTPSSEIKESEVTVCVAPRLRGISPLTARQLRSARSLALLRLRSSPGAFSCSWASKTNSADKEQEAHLVLQPNVGLQPRGKNKAN